MKIYLASPFFNEEQVEREERIKKKLRDLGFEVYSPKEACFCPPNASQELRQKTFNDNIKNILSSNAVFAITNGKDMGTIFEAGVAYQANIPIIYLCEGLTGQFNLMLAQSARLVLTDDNFSEATIYTAICERRFTFTGEIE